MPHGAALALCGVLALALPLLWSASAAASSTQETTFQDDGAILSNPAGTMAQLRALGVQRVRVAVRWLLIAPRADSHTRPNFKSIDPAAYPVKNWAIWDQVVREASSDGLELNFNVVGGAPLWATGPGAPKHSQQTNWEPSPREFGAFMRALGVRYSGNYDPKTKKLDPGNPDDLPAVRFWSIWNEPDYGPSLAPQGVPGKVRIERSPWLYRNLLDAAWRSLHATGHRRDTILFGEVAPRGFPTAQFPHLSWGIFSGMKPIHFLQMLYCVDSRYRRLRGAAAAVRGCPATAGAARRFRAAHPALFSSSGFADHPYSRWYPPNVERQNDPEYTSLADMGRLERALDRLTGAYGSSVHFPIWNTEYGYITSPPKHSPDPTSKVPYISQSTAAYFDNWAEYISWRNPRLRSFAQYLLADPLPSLATNDFGGFASGLLTYARKPKASYGAFRLPVYVPTTTATSRRSLEVWGCARPSKYAATSSQDPDTVAIQLKSDAGSSAPSGLPVQPPPSRSTGSFQTLQTVPIRNREGYFDTRVVFPRSGMMRLMWSYPPADAYTLPVTVFSRTVHITVR